MDQKTAIRFWLGHLATPQGRDAVKVMLDNAPLCMWMIDTMEMRVPFVRCRQIASTIIIGCWYCEAHAPTP